jgi:hypothetical protein
MVKAKKPGVDADCTSNVGAAANVHKINNKCAHSCTNENSRMISAANRAELGDFAAFFEYSCNL